MNLTHKIREVNLAISIARTVYPNFSKEYPEDNRPEKAILSAESWTRNPCAETTSSCDKAARLAILAAETAAKQAKWSAFFAARSAEHVAWAAHSNLVEFNRRRVEFCARLSTFWEAVKRPTSPWEPDKVATPEAAAFNASSGLP